MGGGSDAINMTSTCCCALMRESGDGRGEGWHARTCAAGAFMRALPQQIEPAHSHPALRALIAQALFWDAMCWAVHTVLSAEIGTPLAFAGALASAISAAHAAHYRSVTVIFDFGRHTPEAKRALRPSEATAAEIALADGAQLARLVWGDAPAGGAPPGSEFATPLLGDLAEPTGWWTTPWEEHYDAGAPAGHVALARHERSGEVRALRAPPGIVLPTVPWGDSDLIKRVRPLMQLVLAQAQRLVELGVGGALPGYTPPPLRTLYANVPGAEALRKPVSYTLVGPRQRAAGAPPAPAGVRVDATGVRVDACAEIGEGELHAMHLVKRYVAAGIGATLLSGDSDIWSMLLLHVVSFLAVDAADLTQLGADAIYGEPPAGAARDVPGLPRGAGAAPRCPRAALARGWRVPLYLDLRGSPHARRDAPGRPTKNAVVDVQRMAEALAARSLAPAPELQDALRRVARMKAPERKAAAAECLRAFSNTPPSANDMALALRAYAISTRTMTGGPRADPEPAPGASALGKRLRAVPGAVLPREMLADEVCDSGDLFVATFCDCMVALAAVKALLSRVSDVDPELLELQKKLAARVETDRYRRLRWRPGVDDAERRGLAGALHARLLGLIAGDDAAVAELAAAALEAILLECAARGSASATRVYRHLLWVERASGRVARVQWAPVPHALEAHALYAMLTGNDYVRLPHGLGPAAVAKTLLQPHGAPWRFFARPPEAGHPLGQPQLAPLLWLDEAEIVRFVHVLLDRKHGGPGWARDPQRELKTLDALRARARDPAHVPDAAALAALARRVHWNVLYWVAGAHLRDHAPLDSTRVDAASGLSLYGWGRAADGIAVCAAAAVAPPERFRAAALQMLGA